MKGKIKNQIMGLMLFGMLSEFATAECAASLKIFQITQGYNDGPVELGGYANGDYWGFDFHNGKMVAVWMDDSGTVTSTPPGPVANAVFGLAQVNSPQNVIVAPNVAVSNNLAFRQSIPVIAIDRTNTNHIAITAQNQREIPLRPHTEDSNGMLIVSSTNGGKNWTTNFTLQLNNFQADSKIPIALGLGSGNGRIGYDRFGNLIIPYLSSFAPETTLFYTGTFPFFCYLSSSIDHGKSFKVVQKLDPRDVGALDYSFPLMAVGLDQVAVALLTYGSPGSGSPYTGQLFIYTIEGKGKFGAPTQLTFPDGMLYGHGDGSMAFSPSGGLLIAQTNAEGSSTQSCSILFTSFIPQGAKEFPAATAFQPFKSFVGVGGSAKYPSTNPYITWCQPSVSYVYNGHHYGRVYMAYPDNPYVPASAPSACSYGSTSPGGSDTNIYVVYSDDDGKTWSTPFAIPKTNTNTRMMPNLAVDQTTGNIGVAWLDAVNDPANIKVQVFATVIPWDFFD